MSDIFKLIAEVGFPIVGALVMGYFIFLTIKQMLAGVVGQIQTLTKFCEMLEFVSEVGNEKCAFFSLSFYPE